MSGTSRRTGSLCYVKAAVSRFSRLLKNIYYLVADARVTQIWFGCFLSDWRLRLAQAPASPLLQILEGEMNHLPLPLTYPASHPITFLPFAKRIDFFRNSVSHSGQQEALLLAGKAGQARTSSRVLHDHGRQMALDAHLGAWRPHPVGCRSRGRFEKKLEGIFPSLAGWKTRPVGSKR